MLSPGQRQPLYALERNGMDVMVHVRNCPWDGSVERMPLADVSYGFDYFLRSGTSARPDMGLCRD